MGRFVRRFVRRLFKVVLGLVGLVVIAALVGLYVLLETQRGHDFLLREGLARANGAIEGELTASGLHSAGLLRGLTLTDVALSGPDGIEVVRADSVRAGYSLYNFLRGSIIVSPVELWSPRVLIERLPGEDVFNVQKLIAPSADDEPAPPGERRIAVERVTIHDGEVTVRMPVAEGEEPMDRAVVEEGPNGELFQRYAFTGIEGDIPQVLIQEPQAEGEYIRVQQLSMQASVLDEPFDITDFRGRIERIGTRLSFDADRIWLRNSELAGAGWVDWGGDVLELDLDLNAGIFHLADLHWLDPGLPEITGRLSIRTTGLLNEGLWTISDADLELAESRITGSGGIQLGSELQLVDVDVTATPLALFELERFLPEPLPIAGMLRGRVQADGPLSTLEVNGALSLDEPEVERPPSTATFAGLLHLEDDLGVSDFSLLLEPFHFGLAAEFAPAIAVRGPGSVTLDASGRMGSGVRFVADMTHTPTNFPTSRVTAQGSITGDLNNPSEALLVEVDGALEPVSLDMLARYYPQVPFNGNAAGTFALRGPLSDLDAQVRMETPGGPIAADARFDAFDPGAHYRVEASVVDFELSNVMAEAPEPTRFTGTAYVDGRGFDPASMWATARLEFGASRVGQLDVDTATTFMRIETGEVTFDTILVQTSVMDAHGYGTLGLGEDALPGELRVAFSSETLSGLRPLLLGEESVAVDTLTAIEREGQEMQGVVLEELPDEEDLVVEGHLSGEAVLSGWINDFRTDGTFLLEEFVYGEHALGRMEVGFAADDVRTPEWVVRADVEAEAIDLFGRRYEELTAEADYSRREDGGDGYGEGHALLQVRRNDVEDYRARAAFEVGTDQGRVNLDELMLRFDAVQWNLGAPSIISWSDEAVIVQDLRLVRPGLDGMRVEADGTIPFDGEIDFRLMVESLNLARVAQLAQTEVAIGGILNLGLEVTGQTRAPVMSSQVVARDLRYDEFFLSTMEGELTYLDRRISGDLEATQDGQPVFTLSGHAPLDLAFADIERRLLDAPMELEVLVDAFPAANALSFLENIQDVEGTLNGQIDIRGTPREPSPTGSLQLRGGAMTLPDLGVRYTGLQANLLLDADGSVLVNAEAQSRGTARVEGTIQLSPLTDPGFDLLIVTNNFLAVDRRDMTARMGGEVTLTGTFRDPDLNGDVRLEQATLFLDEFVRSADVIDLTDPRFFDVVDTSLVAVQVQPLIQEGNPFLQNLQVDVNLVVGRDTWLRSREINVEIGGELGVNFDRAREEIVLSGTLQAIRGAYTAFGRQFQVREGTVNFVGTPGIDPNLNIQAVNRLRTERDEPLDIIATVQGTLTNLRVELSSESQPPIAQSDLVSYLIFGRPSFALASGEQSILQDTRGAAEAYGVGAVASQIGSIFAQRIGVDYFAVTQASSSPEAGGVEGAFAATQAEIGHYFFDDLFLAFTARPPVGAQSQGLGWLQGARLEWRFSDLWTVESFIEDRFSRGGATGFADLGIRFSRVYGMSIFREWGY